VRRYVAEVTRLVETAPDVVLPERVAARLEALLREDDLLAPEHREADPARYRKHVLHGDPAGRFTVLAIVWEPGQHTDVHGHTAWGAVGIYEGTPDVTCYDCEEVGDGRHRAVPVKSLRCGPGDVAVVRPGLRDVHRIANGTDASAVTIHTYGCDLVRDPDAINLALNLDA
jgi:predicted metal-dependent enzyme (double-stranded beta helix superfamily)